MQTETRAQAVNMEILIPEDWDNGKQYLPIGEKIVFNKQSICAIPKFLHPPEGNGLFILGSSGGQLQWIATESCDT